MSINLTPIFEAILALAAALITYRLVPWIKAKTTQTQQGNLRALVRTVVFGAEQIYGSGHGREKMQYVQEWLKAHGYEVDVNEIEAVVLEYLNGCLMIPESTKEKDKEEDSETL